MDRIKAWLKQARGTKIIYLSRRLLAAAACAAAAAMMFWVVNNPAVVGASAATRQLPIYCVQTDYKVLSISFDAAWGDVILRQGIGKAIASEKLFEGRHFLAFFDILVKKAGFYYGRTDV